MKSILLANTGNSALVDDEILRRLLATNEVASLNPFIEASVTPGRTSVGSIPVIIRFSDILAVEWA